MANWARPNVAGTRVMELLHPLGHYCAKLSSRKSAGKLELLSVEYLYLPSTSSTDVERLIKAVSSKSETHYADSNPPITEGIVWACLGFVLVRSPES